MGGHRGEGTLGSKTSLSPSIQGPASNLRIQLIRGEALVACERNDPCSTSNALFICLSSKELKKLVLSYRVNQNMKTILHLYNKAKGAQS